MADQTKPDSRLTPPADDSSAPPRESKTLRDSKGWDGKLRLERGSDAANAGAASDDDGEHTETDEADVEQIAADEDLLDDYPLDTDEIDLNHRRISSIPSLNLSRFSKVEKLCLRQNSIQTITGLSCLASTLKDLDLYDNVISHIEGLSELGELTSLDLSFNKIKHVKNVKHLKGLRDLYFVQNRIGRIEGVEGLEVLRNLELAANRIREIENLDSLKALEQLWLGKNKITELKNLSGLSNLKILSIQSNRITKIQGLDALANLEEIYLSHNALTEISGLEHNSRLRVLDISNNAIAHLTGLSHLHALEELWASSNQLSSFDEVERELRDKDRLETVYFEGNPLQTLNRVLYRNKVRLALPCVRQIDATYVRVS